MSVEPLAALLRPSDCTAMRLMLAAEAGGDAAKAAMSAVRRWWLTSCGRMHILCSHKSENVWGRSAGAFHLKFCECSELAGYEPQPSMPACQHRRLLGLRLTRVGAASVTGCGLLRSKLWHHPRVTGWADAVTTGTADVSLCICNGTYA